MRNIFYLLFLIPTFFYGQNVGVGTTNPTEKLEVDGKIKITNPQGVPGAGGIIFPDNSFQNTAYNPVPIDGGGGVLFPDGTFQNTAYVVNLPTGLTGTIALMVNGGAGDISSGYAGPVFYGQVNAGFNILALSVGISNSGTTSNPGNTNFTDVTLSRFSDEYSARIQEDLANEKILSEIKLFTFRNCGGELCYATIETYKDCKWSSYAYGGSGEEQRMTENVSFSYGKRAVQAFDLSSAGGNTAPGSGNPNIMTCWDLVAEAPCSTSN